MVLSGLQTQVAGALAVKTPIFTNCDFRPHCGASELQSNRNIQQDNLTCPAPRPSHDPSVHQLLIQLRSPGYSPDTLAKICHTNPAKSYRRVGREWTLTSLRADPRSLPSHPSNNSQWPVHSRRTLADCGVLASMDNRCSHDRRWS